MDTEATRFCSVPFDYIVVGGGTCGLALACLLSENPAVRVGVIEAGKPIKDDTVLIPGMIGQALGKPEYDWNFVSVPQELAAGRKIPMFRGKLLGGTSGINYMAFTRGSCVEHNDWQSLGISGWDWDIISTSIKASEQWTPPPSDIESQYHASNDSENHGRNGYIKTSSQTYYYDLALPFFSTMNELGIATNYSPSSGCPTGVWTETASLDPETRTRSYSTTAYYDPVASRTNLIVLTSAHATRIVTSSDKRRDQGVKGTAVEFQYEGKFYSVSVNKEIILSCGAIQTPQLLELSGIGKSEVLAKFNINSIVELPGVGENLQDHISVSVGAKLSGQHITAENMQDPDFAQEQLKMYQTSKSGLLSSTPSTFVFIPATDFIPDDVLNSMIAALDIALDDQHFKQSPWKKIYDLQRSWVKNNGVAQLEIVLFPAFSSDTYNDKNSKHYSLSVFPQHCWSRGSVHLMSGLPLDPPAIDYQILNSPADFDLLLLVHAIKYAFKIMQTGALGAETSQIIEPLPTWTDEQLKDYVRKKVNSAWHPVGTASMLPRSQHGVVDNTLKVYGTSNIRVVDASIIPVHLGTHPQATLYGMAHRAAEIIQGNITAQGSGTAETDGDSHKGCCEIS